MTNKRELLMNRMIRIYGFENPIVIQYCKMCEEWTEDAEHDNYLEAIVEAHEEYPQYEDEDEDA